jgi:hypothetical protein
MQTTSSFKFSDESLNRRLISLLTKGKIKHSIDKDGAIHYAANVENAVENDLIGSIRDEVFPAWQILTCPSDWAATYREYMVDHDIPFREELSNGELWFLLPQNFRPHRWKLERPMKTQRLAM